MSFHRKHDQFERARWRKAFLFPVWTAQVAMLLALVGIFAYRLAETIQHYEENDKKGKLPVVEVVWECTNVGFSLLSFVLTLFELSRLFAETLTPFFLLASHIIKTTSASAILALDIVVYIHRSEGNWSIVGLAVDCGLFLSILILCIYSIVAYRRLVASDTYYGSTNVKAFGYGDGYDEIEMSRAVPPSGGGAGDEPFTSMGPGRRYEDRNPVGSSVTAAPYSPYEPYLGARVASGSVGGAAAGPSVVAPAGTPPLGGDATRIISYSHERDAQVDAYRTGEAAPAISREVINDAIGVELWGGSPGGGGGEGGQGSGGAAAINPLMARTAALDRAGSVKSVGVVRSQVVQRPLQVDRTPSWSVEQHLVTAESESGRRGSGGGVPTIVEEERGHGGVSAADDEDEDEDDRDTLFPNQRHSIGAAREDRALLLGHSRQNSEDDDDDAGRAAAKQAMLGTAMPPGNRNLA